MNIKVMGYLRTAREVECLIRGLGAEPATVALIGGRIRIGLADDEMELLGRSGDALKVSRRDLPAVLASRGLGATTVAATMICAALAGIEVFVTGGIGGVHRGAEVSFDISADLQELARRYPVYGEWGFYDAVDPVSGAVAYTYLTLDQSMSFVALVNHLTGHRIQRLFEPSLGITRWKVCSVVPNGYACCSEPRGHPERNRRAVALAVGNENRSAGNNANGAGRHAILLSSDRMSSI